MYNYEITTEITADLNKDLVNELGIIIIPMRYSIEGIEYIYDFVKSELSLSDFYNKLGDEAIVKTTQINPLGYVEYFEPILAAGKDILHIGFSSGLSGSYNSAILAAEILKEQYPNRQCICIDSLSASAGQGLLVYEAAKMKAKGLSIYELQNWIENNKLKIAHWFLVSDLSHLQRGGRISSTTAFVGSLLHVYPILKVNNDGMLEVTTKIRGHKKAISHLHQLVVNQIASDKSLKIMISHSADLESALLLQEKMKNSLPDCSIFINGMSPIIGAHTGKGALTIHFFTNQR